MLKAAREHGLGDDIGFVAQLLVSLAKAASFDMTLMFMDAKERSDLKEILRAVNAAADVDAA